MNALRRIALLVPFALGLAACADAIVSGTGAQEPYDPSFVRYVASQGAFPLELHGNPSGLSDAAFTRLIEERVRLSPAFGDAAFSTTPETANGHDFRLVLVFNAENTRIDPRDVCRGEGLENAGEPRPRLHLRGVFCEGTSVISANSAYTAAPEDFRDPVVGRLLDRLVFDLLPPEGMRDVHECPNAMRCP